MTERVDVQRSHTSRPHLFQMQWSQTLSQTLERTANTDTHMVLWKYWASLTWDSVLSPRSRRQNALSGAPFTNAYANNCLHEMKIIIMNGVIILQIYTKCRDGQYRNMVMCWLIDTTLEHVSHLHTPLLLLVAVRTALLQHQKSLLTFPSCHALSSSVTCQEEYVQIYRSWLIYLKMSYRHSLM